MCATKFSANNQQSKEHCLDELLNSHCMYIRATIITERTKHDSPCEIKLTDNNCFTLNKLIKYFFVLSSFVSKQISRMFQPHYSTSAKAQEDSMMPIATFLIGVQLSLLPVHLETKGCHHNR